MTDGTAGHGGQPVPLAVNQFGTPVAVNQFGTPVAVNQPGQPYGAPAYPQAGWPPPPPGGWPAPPQRVNTTSRVWLGVGVAVGSIFLLLVAVAVAIPLVVRHSTDRITLPDTLVGMSRTHDQDAQLRQLLTRYDGLGLGQPEAATYRGSGGQVAVVIVAGHSLSEANQRGYLIGFSRGEQQDYGVTTASVPAGPLGGSMVCGEVSGRRTDCGYEDDGGYGVIDVSGTGQVALDLVLEIRSAVELHR
jgi:hypothetical protein